MNGSKKNMKLLKFKIELMDTSTVEPQNYEPLGKQGCS